MALRAATLSIVLAATAFSAAAQQPAQRPQPSQTQRQPGQTPEWYGAQLTELAEVLGGTHYLRILCNGRTDQRWRDFMRGIIDREPTYNRNGELVEAFNRGYRTEETQFPECNSTAQQTEAELRARGVRVSQALSARHGER